MKVLHLIAGDLSGGAARGAYWLHKGLVELGTDSKIWTNSKITFGDDRVVTINKTKKDKIFNMIRTQLDVNMQIFYKNRKKVIFSTGFFGVDFTKSLEYKEADIIHLHWINGGFVNIKDLSKIDKPIVWTMRDMWPMTGGCHVAGALNCKNFTNGCGNCKQLNSNYNFDLSKIVLNRKIKYLPKHIKIVGISNWLSNEAKKSLVFKDFDVRTIYNNVNSNEFYPIDKKVAKEVLNIKTDKKIILVGAQNLNDFYKGFNKFIEAVKLLNRNKYFLAFFGNLDENLVKDLGFEYKNFGFLYDILSLRLLYSMSDIFVAPSLMDAFGKTLVESMNSQTPVVCFDATGPKDIIEHKITGYKAMPFDSEDLAKGIEWIVNLEENEYINLSKNCRIRAKKLFDSDIIANQYIKLYKEII